MQFLTKKACAPGSFIASPSSLNVCHQIIGRLYERAHSHTLFDIANSFSSLFLFFLVAFWLEALLLLLLLYCKKQIYDRRMEQYSKLLFVQQHSPTRVDNRTV